VWVVKRQNEKGNKRDREMKGWDVTVAKNECPGSRNGARSKKTKGKGEQKRHTRIVRDRKKENGM